MAVFRQCLDLAVKLFHQWHQCWTNVREITWLQEAFIPLQNAEQKKSHITFITRMKFKGCQIFDVLWVIRELVIWETVID